MECDSIPQSMVQNSPPGRRMTENVTFGKRVDDEMRLDVS